MRTCRKTWGTPYVVEEPSDVLKRGCNAYGITEEWYRYRDAALGEIAIAWCEAYGIAYTE